MGTKYHADLSLPSKHLSSNVSASKLVPFSEVIPKPEFSRGTRVMHGSSSCPGLRTLCTLSHSSQYDNIPSTLPLQAEFCMLMMSQSI